MSACPICGGRFVRVGGGRLCEGHAGHAEILRESVLATLERLAAADGRRALDQLAKAASFGLDGQGPMIAPDPGA